MITIIDCLALAALTEEEADAIAEHEHLPEILGVMLGACLMQSRAGQLTILRMIDEDLAEARLRRNFRHARELIDVHRRFVASHAEALAA